MSVLSSAVACTTDGALDEFPEYAETYAEQVGIDELTRFSITSKKIPNGERDVIAIAGFKPGYSREFFFLCNDYYDRLENGVLALDYDRTYYKEIEEKQFPRVQKAVERGDWVLLDKVLPEKKWSERFER